MKPLKPLQKRPKFKCPDCKKSYSQVWKCKDGKKRCTNCKRTLPTNKFYIPLKERKNLQGTIGKFSMTTWERQRLYNQFINEGLSPEEASQKIRQHIGLLKFHKAKRKYSDKERRRYFAMRDKESKELKEKFIEGLR